MPARVVPDELLTYLRAGAPPVSPTPLEQWVGTSPRFAAFVDEYRAKVRKKLRSAREADGVRDVLCELETAFYLLREPRFSLAYEAYAATQQRAPDFTLTYRTHLACHVEAARLRTSPAPDAERLGELIAGKLGQMLPSAPNVLVVAARALPEVPLEQVLKQLQSRAERDDALLFARAHVRNRSEFFKFYTRLSAVILRGLWDVEAQRAPLLWLNKQARHPLPAQVMRPLLACFTPA